MTYWRLIDDAVDDPLVNMATEEALLITCEEGSSSTLRLWISRKCVVLGRFQNLDLEVNLDLCNSEGITIVRRFTGGGAVYHDEGNLNWSFFVNKEDESIRNVSSKGMTGIFRKLSEGVLNTISSTGLKSDFKSPNLISVEDRKVSGMAGSIKRNSVLCHGTLLVNTNLEDLRDTLTPPQPIGHIQEEGVRYVKSARVPTTSLEKELGRHLNMAEIKETLVRNFEDVLQIRLEHADLTEREKHLSASLWRGKYSLASWNLEAKRGENPV